MDRAELEVDGQINTERGRETERERWKDNETEKILQQRQCNRCI